MYSTQWRYKHQVAYPIWKSVSNFLNIHIVDISTVRSET